MQCNTTRDFKFFCIILQPYVIYLQPDFLTKRQRRKLLSSKIFCVYFSGHCLGIKMASSKDKGLFLLLFCIRVTTNIYGNIFQGILFDVCLLYVVILRDILFQVHHIYYIINTNHKKSYKNPIYPEQIFILVFYLKK